MRCGAGDLKPDNVLVSDNFVAKVADLGASTRFDQEEALRRVADHEGDSMLSSQCQMFPNRMHFTGVLVVVEQTRVKA